MIRSSWLCLCLVCTSSSIHPKVSHFLSQSDFFISFLKELNLSKRLTCSPRWRIGLSLYYGIYQVYAVFVCEISRLDCYIRSLLRRSPVSQSVESVHLSDCFVAVYMSGNWTPIDCLYSRFDSTVSTFWIETKESTISNLDLVLH